MTGRVDGVAGPVPALVTVTAHDADGAVVGTVRTDADGRYRLDVPAGPLTLVAVEHPAVHEAVTVRAGLAQRHDITLPPDTSAPPEPDPEPLAGAVGVELR
ncbi:carboxypeptidase-like regulatory domain-containing protein [Pseudonocardia halophobica]|uniref:carboxypeptidase-like regulatory domain-containing protein n=1 Tax=Pseudonocardia halophobica TaxID=29401 RepID=UPI0022AEEA6C|nr:carboxypeptidase-like regulatory domain-containing protein [Pseudonocardia halophobica]